MENETQNPYKTPEASLDTAQGKNLSEIYTRFSAWAVLGLSIITLGIYSVFWLYGRSKAINAVSDEPIGAAFVNTTIVLFVLSSLNTITGFFDIIPPDNVGLVLMSSIISFASSIMIIVWVFKIRDRIHLYSGREKGDSAWAGPILTFFLNILYLQYKINQTIDEE